VPGYRAKQNADGTWTVHDVPVFCATQRELRDGSVFEFDESWLRDAVRKANERLQHGYLAPLHIHHTSDERGKVYAGFLLPKRVAPFTFSDGTLPTIFADYLQVPDHVFRAMQRGELPYVSIETRDASKREISACALMPDDVPHAKFPLFTIAEALPHGNGPTYAQPATCVGSAVSFASCGGVEFAALSRFPAMTRKLTSKTYDQAAREFVFKFDDGSQERAKSGGAFEFADAGGDAPKGGEGAGGEGEKPKAKDGMTVKDLESALKGMTLTLAEIGELKAILEAAAKAAGGESTENEGEGKKPPAPNGNPPEAQMSQDALKTAMEAKAEAAAAKSQLAEFQAERAKEQSLAKAAKELDGYVLQDGELAAIFAEGGPKGLEIYVAARKKHGRKAPTPGVGGVATTAEIEMAELPKDFEFSSDPGLREKQVKASKAYDASSASTKQRMTRKRFIECNTLSANELARAGR
jgi:hypothetical protein